ncbi:type II toxin-antitoxin system PemK/MazF family toxin [bacterium]|nr:type II toxin-antitoxin system PemK/MazF family toxin [bacterium]
MVVNRFEIYIVSLDPVKGSELRKTRPCVVVSPDEINHNINAVIITPMTTSSKQYPTRISVEFQGKKRLIVLDQIRTIGKSRLVKKVGKVNHKTGEKIVAVLKEMFAL